VAGGLESQGGFVTEVRTQFDPHLNGFQFPNRFPGGAVVAELVRQNRLSELTGLKVPRAIRTMTELASNEDFWGTFGLCGGMSSLALQRFGEGTAVPATHTIPAGDDELFHELVGEQADSLKGRTVLERCLIWQLLPDRAPWWMFWTKGVAQQTVQMEWPKLQASLGRGAPLLLVLLRAQGITSPAQNHQVVATGYDVAGDGDVTVHIYDPNHPRSEPTFPIDLQPNRRSQAINRRAGTRLLRA
jgi:hypothetical protein